MFVGMKRQNKLELIICGALVRLIMRVYFDKIWDAGEKIYYEEFSLPSLGLLDVMGCAVITLKPQDTFELNYIAKL